MISILKVLYAPYNLKLRLSLCFFIYFLLALCIRSLAFKNNFIILFSVLVFCVMFWISITPLMLDTFSVWYCKLFEYLYRYVFNKNYKLIKILNLFYSLRNTLTRGHAIKLFFYNIVLTVLFFINIPHIQILRVVLGIFLLLGSVIDILHQCFMFYGYKGSSAYRGKWRERYRYLEWSKDNSLWLQVRYNQIVLQRLHYMFEDENLLFYSREVLFYGFRPAYVLDVFLNRFFRKKN